MATRKLIEQRFPAELLTKASLKGNEYAWPLPEVDHVVTFAAAHALAISGGQAQFRLPSATCEMYWLSASARPREEGESWNGYVARAIGEFLEQFRDLCTKTDFVREGVSAFDVLEQEQKAGVDLRQHLCFVLYFEEEPPMRHQTEGDGGVS